MFSIKQSVKRSMWVEAAEALASALSMLPRDKQIALASSFIQHAREEIQEASKGRWRIEDLDLPPVPESETKDPPPWQVHVADASDDLNELKADPPQDDAEFSSRIAAVLWDSVVGLQVAAWAATETGDFRAWQLGRDARGVFESLTGKKVATNQWLQLDRQIRKFPEFKGKTDLDIYQVRPAVFAFRNIIEAV